MGRYVRLWAIAGLFLTAVNANADVVANAALTGGSAVPPNISNGTGSTRVTMDSANQLLIQAVYDGLDSPPTNAMLFCCAGPGATAFPVLAAPLKLQSLGGSRGRTDPTDEKHDMTVATNWDNYFYSTHGGTPQSAFAALQAALSSGMVYLNIVTADYPGGELRADLKGGAVPFVTVSGNQTRVQFLRGANTLDCSDLSERCVIPVYVRATGDTSCEASTDFQLVTVPPPPGAKPIRLVWLLVNGQVGDGTEFQFHQTSGIKLRPTTSGTSPDPAKDFDAPGDDNHEARRFKWNSVHKRTWHKFPYDINVNMYNANNGKWWPCWPVDPTISNR